MQTHIKVLAWLYILLSAIGLISAAWLGGIIAAGGVIPGDRDAVLVTSIVAVVLAGVVVLFSTPGLIAGLGLLRYKSWARVLGLVLGILNLPGFPTGTILGVYSLYVLLDDESAALFSG